MLVINLLRCNLNASTRHTKCFSLNLHHIDSLLDVVMAEDTAVRVVRPLPKLNFQLLLMDISCSAPVQTVRTLSALIFTNPNHHSSNAFFLSSLLW
jgi:hypothetical protein